MNPKISDLHSSEYSHILIFYSLTFKTLKSLINNLSVSMVHVLTHASQAQGPSQGDHSSPPSSRLCGWNLHVIVPTTQPPCEATNLRLPAWTLGSVANVS